MPEELLELFEVELDELLLEDEVLVEVLVLDDELEELEPPEEPPIEPAEAVKVTRSILEPSSRLRIDSV
jgi:hypothetical protein